MTYPPLAAEPIAKPTAEDASSVSAEVGRDTLLSQYATSPVIGSIVASWSESFAQDNNVDDFYLSLWNVATAKGYGLDVLGRIVGVSRILKIPNASPYIGWASDAYNWGNGIWSGLGAATSNYSLSDDAFRRLVLAKAAFNICDGSIKATNAVLMSLFPNRGNCYVADNGDMTMTYVFGKTLTAVEYAIVTQSGALPKPAGVSFTVQQP